MPEDCLGNNELKDYKVFSIKFEESSKSSHDIFVKPHSRTLNLSPDRPVGRTLFIANVPPWANLASIRRLFLENGHIESLDFSKSPSKGSCDESFLGFKFCFVVFERPSSLERVMNDMKNSVVYSLSTRNARIPVGLQLWKLDYNRSLLADPESKEEEIRLWVAEYDKSQMIHTQGDEDGDGWTTVSRSTSRKPVLKSQSHAKIKARELKKRKRKELENFYKFQVKESKIQKLEELRTKFESDKKKQLLMIGDRKFKPL